MNFGESPSIKQLWLGVRLPGFWPPDVQLGGGRLWWSCQEQRTGIGGTRQQILVGKHKANTKKRWIVFVVLLRSMLLSPKTWLLITLFFMFIPSQVQMSVCCWYKCCLTEFPPDHFRQVHSIKSQADHFMIAPKWPRKAWHPIYVVFVDTEFQPEQSFKLIALCEIYTLVNKHRPWK